MEKTLEKIEGKIVEKITVEFTDKQIVSKKKTLDTIVEFYQDKLDSAIAERDEFSLKCEELEVSLEEVPLEDAFTETITETIPE